MLISQYSYNLYIKSIINKRVYRYSLPLLYFRRYCNASDNYWINSSNAEEVEIKFKDKLEYIY